MSSILIKNGRIIDGSGSPWFIGDIFIENEKIKAIGKLDFNADKVIDATGLYVAPGFIDSHSHSDITSMTVDIADGESKILQGVTTEIGGMCGISAAPIANEFRKEICEYSFSMEKESIKAAKNWSTFSEWINYINKNIPLSIDLFPFVGHGNIRASVMGFSSADPTPCELNKMKEYLIEAMESGALGLSSGLIYPPGLFCKTNELIELCKILPEYDGIYISHIRNEGSKLIESIEEAIEIGRRAGCKVQISHYKASGKGNHGKAIEGLSIIEKAREEGIDITLDVYPYNAGATSFISVLPDWAHEGGVQALMERVKCEDTRKKMAIDIDYSEYTWSRIMISSAGKNKSLIGKTVLEIANSLNKSCEETAFDIILEEETNVGMITFGADEAENQTIYQSRLAMVGSDSSVHKLIPEEGSGNPHPRAFGTFPKVIGKFARDLKLFPLETAIYKMTGYPASRFKLFDRGRIEPMKQADIVIFDYAAINDTAEYTNAYSAPTGIPYVIFKGEIAVDNGVYKHNTLGRIVAVAIK